MLLDLVSNLKSIPTTKDGGIKFPDFYEVPEVKSVITLLKHLKVNIDYLEKNGFVIATMLIGGQLKNKITVKLDPSYARRKGKKYIQEHGWSDEAIDEALEVGIYKDNIKDSNFMPLQLRANKVANDYMKYSK